MPNPAQYDLHVNQPLSNVSIAYMQNADTYISSQVFPKVPVQKQSDLYWKYSKSDWRRTDATVRAPSTESAGVGWNLTTDSYFAQVYAVHKDIDDQLRANADSNFSLDRDATQFITNQLLLKREIDWAARYFTTSVWGTTDQTGVSGVPSTNQFKQWDASGSDPLNDISGAVVNFVQLTGFKPNKLVIGANVMKTLKNHSLILDRIKYTQRGVVTEDLLSSLFGMQVLVPYATQAAGANINDAALQDAGATYSFVTGGKSVLMLYAPPAPSLLTPSAGYTFTWSGYTAGNAEGLRVKSFRMENIASDRIEAEMTYDMKIVASDMGQFFTQVVQ